MLTFIAAAAWAGSPVETEQPGGANLSVGIELACGSLIVRGSDRQTVRVGGSVEDPDALQVTSGPGTVSIEIESKHARQVCADLVIDVPAAAAIDVESVSAGVTVEGVTGPADLETVSGAIALTGDAARLDATSISGEIRVTGRIRRLQAETVSGAIGLSGVGGSLELSSVSGEIRVEAASALDAVTAETVSGAIGIHGALAAQGRMALGTHAGQLTLALPGATNAIVSWSTFAGHVTNTFGADAHDSQIRLGTGDGRITLETFAGGIAITRRD